ncbi:hypothetical protein MIND_00536800 [Mycena indigotica]|uniref:Uncharacterized protein n=1 Tax=Mycena indigotica TaxID=2126181 RepID=A0A8H6W6A6_9AGAR|nr:uncharacterized protein MIND_00536800 [Mycena indigotica]KAF7307424.1 hypothetical protein MIND_00536800 [Mycena indigotica]
MVTRPKILNSPTTMESELFNILRGYAGLYPPQHLNFPSTLPLELLHDFFLNQLLLDPHFEAFPPSEQYQKTFWKWTIAQLERKLADSDFEIDSRIYDHYLALLNTTSQSGPPSQSYITHFWKPLGSEITTAHQKTTLLESRTMIEGGTTGMRTWLASLVLAQHLITNPDIVQHKRVLELGAGIGFLGCIVATIQHLQGAYGALWLTDINETVLSRCQDNIKLTCNLSSSHPHVRCCSLDWSAALEGLAPVTSLLDEIAPELILGADIVFDPELIPPLVAILRLSLRPKPRSMAIIALTLRNPATMQKFLDAVANVNDLVLEDIDPEPTSHDMFVEGVEGSATVKIFKIQYRA